MPEENDHWSCFYYSPQTSPFRVLRHLRHLPASVAERGRVRRYLSRAIAAAYGFTGYFQIYNVPFEELPYFDYVEKRDLFVPGGVNRGTSIFDDLRAAGVPYHVSDWRAAEAANLASLETRIRARDVSFAFLYTGKLDALLHEATRLSDRVDVKLREYQLALRRLLALAAGHYDEVRFALFSDHGMATVHKTVDWMPRVEASGLRFGVDYAAIFDSTMLRFWFLRRAAEQTVRNLLPDGADGRWLTDEDLRAYGAFWPDRRFGHAIYALEPGVLLSPSHMGKLPMAGMHGYRPDHADSDSTLLASFTPENPVSRITDLYHLMREMARWSAQALPEKTGAQVLTHLRA